MFTEIYCDSVNLEEINQLLAVQEAANEGTGFNYIGGYKTLEGWITHNSNFAKFFKFNSVEELINKVTEILNPYGKVVDQSTSEIQAIKNVRRSNIDLKDIYLISPDVGYEIYAILEEAVRFVTDNPSIFNNPSGYPLPI